MSTTASFYLDTRRMKLSSLYPIKLQVYSQHVTKLYPTIFDLSKEDYAKLSSPRIGSNLVEIREKLKSIMREWDDYLKDVDRFDFHQFEKDIIAYHKLFKNRKRFNQHVEIMDSDNFDYSPYIKRFKSIFEEDHSKFWCISYTFNSSIKRLLKEGRIGTALSYKDAYNSIKKFRGNVLFTDIDVSFLTQYENWMTERGNSKTTIGIKIRTLRTMFNDAIDEGIIKKDKYYPFGRKRYRIPTGRNIKKALPNNLIKSLYEYIPETTEENKAKDFWFFCYYANGMNPKDVVHLKYKNIHDDFIVFIRAKTERSTCEDPKPITVYLNEDMRQIITKWGNKEKDPGNYIFPFINSNMNPMQRYSIVTYFTRFINDRMDVIGTKLGFEKKLTTIVSRHSFSTQMKRSGASTEFIQEALGHTNKKTTENYLDSFENTLKKEFSKKLLSFKDSLEFNDNITG